MDTPTPDPVVLIYTGAGVCFGALPMRDLRASEVAAWLPTAEEQGAALASGCYRPAAQE